MQFSSIKDVLIFWREQHSDKPITWFARRSGVSASTLQRIFDGGTKNPGFPTGRSICLNAFDNQTEALKALIALYPDKASYINSDAKSFRQITNKKDSAIYDAYNDYCKWKILHFASIDKLSTKTVESFGRQYVNKAMELVEDGLLELTDNKYSAKIEMGHLTNGKILIKAVDHIAQALKDKSDRGASDQDGQIFYIVDGLSDTGKSEAKRLILECSEKIVELRKNQINCGTQPVSIMMTLSDLD